MTTQKSSKKQMVVSNDPTPKVQYGWDQIQLLENGEMSFMWRNDPKNPMSIAFINLIRRVMLTDIPVYAIDRNELTFVDSTCMIHQDLLSHRFSMCPVNMEVMIADAKRDTLEFQLNVKNDKAEMMNVSLSEIKVQRPDNSGISGAIWVYPSMLIARLRPTQLIHAHGPLRLGTARMRNAAYHAVVAPRYHFGYDEQRMMEMVEEAKAKKWILNDEDEIRYRTSHREQAFSAFNPDYPKEFYMTFENVGNYGIWDIMPMVIHLIRYRFQSYLTVLRALKDANPSGLNGNGPWEVSNRLTVMLHKSQLYCFDIYWDYDEYSAWDLLTQTMREMSDVTYVGTMIAATKDPKIKVRIAVEDNEWDTVHRIMTESIEIWLKRWDECLAQWNVRTPTGITSSVEKWLLQDFLSETTTITPIQSDE